MRRLADFSSRRLTYYLTQIKGISQIVCSRVHVFPFQCNHFLLNLQCDWDFGHNCCQMVFLLGKILIHFHMNVTHGKRFKGLGVDLKYLYLQQLLYHLIHRKYKLQKISLVVDNNRWHVCNNLSKYWYNGKNTGIILLTLLAIMHVGNKVS